jgi:hypothetical protein
MTPWGFPGGFQKKEFCQKCRPDPVGLDVKSVDLTPWGWTPWGCSFTLDALALNDSDFCNTGGSSLLKKINLFLRLF